jgi:small subunit ribosomal protein S16
MLRIRLQRFGTKNEPTYRLVVAEQSIRRDGRFVEVLGNYNPAARGKAIPLSINVERVDHWIKLGAQPSDTAKSLVKRARAAAAIPAKA